MFIVKGFKLYNKGSVRAAGDRSDFHAKARLGFHGVQCVKTALVTRSHVDVKCFTKDQLNFCHETHVKCESNDPVDISAHETVGIFLIG